MGNEYIATRIGVCAQRIWRSDGDFAASLPGLDMVSPLASGTAAGCISGDFIVIQILANPHANFAFVIVLPGLCQLSLS
jgi:hypothetical protein